MAKAVWKMEHLISWEEREVKQRFIPEFSDDGCCPRHCMKGTPLRRWIKLVSVMQGGSWG